MVVVFIADVHFDPLLYPRELHPKGTGDEEPFWVYAHTMARDLRAGRVLPPIVLTKLDGKNVLIDGYNRLLAHKRNAKTEIEAEFITCANYDEAYVQAIQRNITHGWRLNDYELSKAAKKLQQQFGRTEKEISDILSIPPLELKRMTEERNIQTPTGTLTLKRMFVGQQLPANMSDQDQRFFSAKTQLDVCKEFLELIESPLLQVESKSIRAVLDEIFDILRQMRQR